MFDMVIIYSSHQIFSKNTDFFGHFLKLLSTPHKQPPGVMVSWLESFLIFCKNPRGFKKIFSKNLGEIGGICEISHLMLWRFEVFLEGFVFPIFCYQNQMCTTGSITSENKGGGSDPLWKISISKSLFFNMASLSNDCLVPR